MTLYNDHMLLTVVSLGAISLYVAEMLFFWSRWRRLSMQMSQEGSAQTLIQELRAEMDVLAEEVAGLRRQLMHSHVEENRVASIEVPGASAQGHARVRPAVPTPFPVPMSSSHSKKPPVRTEERERVSTPPPAARPPSPQNATAHTNFSRGVEMLHRRVVELARSGMDSAAIATECQLSQTETELILSLNGIKRTA